MDSTGRVIPLVPLDQPYVTDSRVIGFVDECIRRSFGHDYENFRMTINDAKECYTPTGASEFEEAISSLIRDVINMNLVMSASLETTVVVREGRAQRLFHMGNADPGYYLSARHARDDRPCSVHCFRSCDSCAPGAGCSGGFGEVYCRQACRVSLTGLGVLVSFKVIRGESWTQRYFLKIMAEH